MKTFLIKHYIVIANILIVVFPAIVDAGLLSNSTFAGGIYSAVRVIFILVSALLSVAVLVFIFGVIKFLMKSGSKTDIENGRKYMLWGIIALFVLLSVRVIVGQISNAFGIGDINANEGTILLPQ